MCFQARHCNVNNLKVITTNTLTVLWLILSPIRETYFIKTKTREAKFCIPGYCLGFKTYFWGVTTI